jgi:hypothetical protein
MYLLHVIYLYNKIINVSCENGKFNGLSNRYPSIVYILPPFQVIRRFDFGQSQTALNLTKFVEKIVTFLIQDKFIIKIYLIIDLMKLI